MAWLELRITRPYEEVSDKVHVKTATELDVDIEAQKTT